MAEFIAKAKKSRHGTLYVDIPGEIMAAMGLRPFMAGRLKFENGIVRLYDFQKTKKIKINLEKAAIARLGRIMKLEGYGSLDETISNIVEKVFGSQEGKNAEGHIVYIYPAGFLNGKFDLINDYEKSMKRRRKSGKTGVKN